MGRPSGKQGRVIRAVDVWLCYVVVAACWANSSGCNIQILQEVLEPSLDYAQRSNI